MEQRSSAANPGSLRPSVRTLVIAGTRLYREGLSHLLARDPRIEVVGTAGDIAGGLTAIAASAPDGVVLDVAMATDRWAVGELVAASPSPNVRVVAFGVADDEATVIACAEAGVAGYVSCEADVDELVTVMLGAIDDELVCGPRLAGTLLRRIGALARERRESEPDVPRLTARESEIIALIGGGLSNKAIAAELHISLPTVKKHIHNLLAKLGASRRAEAVVQARSLHLRVPDRIS